MQPYIISPSILSANFAKLGEDVNAVLKAGADWIHLDVMDNHYVPNLTFGPMVVEALRGEGIRAHFDVHLMVEPVDALIPMFVAAGADTITFHPEASKHPHRTIQLIRDARVSAGLAFNPGSSLEPLDYLLEEIDLVLMMSVNPGFGGQKFIPQVLDRIANVRQRIDASGRNIRLSVDGGVTANNIRQIADAGADTFVAGSAVFKAPDYKNAIQSMRDALAAS